MLLVLMDNSSAEYTFITTFFPQSSQDLGPKASDSSGTVFSPSDSRGLPAEDTRRASLGAETIGSPPLRRRESLTQSISNNLLGHRSLSKEELSTLTTIWKQVLEPTLNYCQASNSSTHLRALGTNLKSNQHRLSQLPCLNHLHL